MPHRHRTPFSAYGISASTYRIERQDVRAVDGITCSIEKEKTLGVVGESACGKTVTGLAILGLVQSPPGRIAGGQIR